MKTYLKIKIKSLAAEAIIIKQEERRWWKFIGSHVVVPTNGPSYMQDVYRKDHPLTLALRQHRIHEVRTECRSANIAYGYLRGRAYKQIENKCYEQPNWQRIAELVYKYGRNIDRKLALDLVKNWSKEEIKQAA